MALSMPAAVSHVSSYNGGSKPPRRYAGVNLFVKNLDATFDDQRLWELFSKFGLIISCKVQADENGVSKGFGFVCFTNVNEASLAIAELNGRVVGTKPLYVNVFESKEERAKNRMKKAVEYLEFSSDMVKPSSYEEFLQLSMARGRGRGRGRGRSSDPGLAPLSPELPFGTGVAMAARTSFSPPSARMPPQSSEPLIFPGMVNSMAAHTPFSSPRPQISPYYSGITGATGAMDIFPLPKSASQSVAKPEEEQQLPTEDNRAMAQLAGSLLQKHEPPYREKYSIYKQACSTPTLRAELSPNGGAGDSRASSSRYASVEYISPFVYRGGSASISPDYRAAAGSLDSRGAAAGSPGYGAAGGSPNGAVN